MYMYVRVIMYMYVSWDSTIPFCVVTRRKCHCNEKDTVY